MLYNLLYPLSVDYSILNIFKYITFRSAWALVTALAVSILVGPYFIRWLQAIKCRQEILKEVKAHQCKAGTPTMGGLLVAETLSVILQVSYFKASGGKRIFRMAPLHHHYEMKGIPESKIIIRFWIISVMLGLIALSALKLR